MRLADALPVYRTLTEVDVRAHEDDGKSKVYEFTAATENAVDTFFGPEVLRMSGARLKRFRSNPVLLDSHNRFEASAVIGRVKVRVDGRQLVAQVTFANTPRAQEVRQLVDDGFLRAVSVGFIPNEARIKRLARDETDGEGASQVIGPARVIQEWELIELSMVPVPADQEALRRSLFQRIGKEAAVQYQNAVGEGTPPPAPAAPAAETRAPATPAPAKPEPKVEHLPEELEQRRLAAVAGQIRAICPKGLDGVADELVATGATLEEARRRFLEEIKGRSQVVGTPEPTQDPGPREELTEDVVARALRAVG